MPANQNKPPRRKPKPRTPKAMARTVSNAKPNETGGYGKDRPGKQDMWYGPGGTIDYGRFANMPHMNGSLPTTAQGFRTAQQEAAAREAAMNQQMQQAFGGYSRPPSVGFASPPPATNIPGGLYDYSTTQPGTAPPQVAEPGNGQLPGLGGLVRPPVGPAGAQPTTGGFGGKNQQGHNAGLYPKRLWGTNRKPRR